MFVITAIVEDIQFNARHNSRTNIWEVIQCNVHSGEEIVTLCSEVEFAATLALMIAGDGVFGSITDQLYQEADKFVEKQTDVLLARYPEETEEGLEQRAFAFRMIP